MVLARMIRECLAANAKPTAAASVAQHIQYRPANAMMRKLFDRFLDRDGSGAQDLLAAMGAGLDQVVPVRLVSHHLRLLGLLQRGPQRDLLVLVDDDTREDP